MILTIEYDANSRVLKKVQQHIDWALKHNPDMNGVRLTIERGDYTSMSGNVEGHAAVTLFHDVQRIIENEKRAYITPQLIKHETTMMEIQNVG